MREWIGYHGQTAQLAPGDVLLLYTDGLTDSHAPAWVLSRADLIPVLASVAGHSARRILERLESATLEPRGVDARDDIAVLVLRVLEGRPEVVR